VTTDNNQVVLIINNRKSFKHVFDFCFFLILISDFFTEWMYRLFFKVTFGINFEKYNKKLVDYG
jgi:hypothetical protein